MILLRQAAERGHADAGGLDSRHAFSSGDYYDPRWMGFGPLRVLDENRIAPGVALPPQRRANMEILTWVVAGALAHRDGSGAECVLPPGALQCISAGRGGEHADANASDAAPVHFLRLWLQPDRVNAPPTCAQRGFAAEALAERLCLVAAPAAEAAACGALGIRQDARVYAARLPPGRSITYPLPPGRRAWLQVVRGEIDLEGMRLGAGDGAGITDAGSLRITTGSDAELLLLDLP